MINFRKRSLNQQKSQFEKFRKYPKKCMKNAWKHEIKCKRKGKKDIPSYEEENFAKNPEEIKKNCRLALSNSEREKKVWKPFWKVSLKHQTLIFKNLIHEFRLIENQFRLIETVSFDWWTKCMSMWCNVFQKQSFKPSFPQIKIFKL